MTGRWYDPKVELTQTRDLPPDLLNGFAEVYAEALELRRRGEALAERWSDLDHDLGQRVAGENVDDHPLWEQSGCRVAGDAVQNIADVVESILLCRVMIHGGHSVPCECRIPDPEWPVTAAPLPGEVPS